MNLLMVSVLLLAMLAFQPTLIYGSKGLASGSFGSATGNGKKHSALSAAKSKASLVMQMESGDVYIRKARGAGGDLAASAGTVASTGGSNIAGNISGGGGGGGGGGGKRGKNNNNKKSNKNATPEQTSAQSQTTSGRKHLDKKFSAASGNHQHQQQQQQHGGNTSNNNNKNKQRQFLKSQPHQNHSKRGGAGTKSAMTNGEKVANGDKSQSTCRYAKSAWTECDTKTNSKSRTLTLKKGESNCLPTRTIQKKCKKACRYEKGSWSECADGQMTRQDKLKSTGSVDSSSCEALRSINKKCNPGNGGGGSKGTKTANKERKNKDKAARRAQQQA